MSKKQPLSFLRLNLYLAIISALFFIGAFMTVAGPLATLFMPGQEEFFIDYVMTASGIIIILLNCAVWFYYGYKNKIKTVKEYFIGILGFLFVYVLPLLPVLLVFPDERIRTLQAGLMSATVVFIAAILLSAMWVGIGHAAAYFQKKFKIA